MQSKNDFNAKENVARRVTLVCKHCGSDELLRDAFSEWNKETQTWELHSTYDKVFCHSDECDGSETKAIEKEIANV